MNYELYNSQYYILCVQEHTFLMNLNAAISKKAVWLPVVFIP